ncbi:GatB/YqeY domain-containing protein [Candidatus Saccharibacteria bacterium]|nr:GatB/YqeY domain-containing protein [Candidatus Saccharibacteria bacterium]
MGIKDQINSDLKEAMLSRNSQMVETLRGIKSAMQYDSVALGPDAEQTDQQVMTVLKKESKKRADAAELYEKAGDKARQEKELFEKEVIQKYLPEEMSESEVSKLVEKAISEIGEVDQKNMGQIIGKVKQASNGLADGAVIAKFVKERLN